MIRPRRPDASSPIRLSLTVASTMGSLLIQPNERTLARADYKLSERSHNAVRHAPPSLTGCAVPSLRLPHCPYPHRLTDALQRLLAAVLEPPPRRRSRPRAHRLRAPHLAPRPP